MTEAMLDSTLKLTAEQRRQFDDDGFFLVEEAISKSEIETLLAVTDELYQRYQRERLMNRCRCVTSSP